MNIHVDFTELDHHSNYGVLSLEENNPYTAHLGSLAGMVGGDVIGRWCRVQREKKKGALFTLCESQTGFTAS